MPLHIFFLYGYLVHLLCFLQKQNVTYLDEPVYQLYEPYQDSMASFRQLLQAEITQI